ncbi:hypothetical protein LCGC14_0422760 [marine sediment metagenome]|uniref:DpnD/PcfM-like C-terminal domain-containing protein n=1 Tax=marine sediment metagenome TaxID=412755 RepID=A0A0F9VZJ3_9ZZZZ
MDEYEVEIEETLSRIVTVEAENSDDAEDKVREDYGNGDIVLDSDDFQDVNFEIV